LNDPILGGGRLLGEGCHFLDLIVDVVGAQPEAVVATAARQADVPRQCVEDFAVTVRFADGSLGTLLYGTVGASAAGKELIEAQRGDRSARLEDFRTLRLWGGSRTRTERARGQDKGHSEELRMFAAVVRGDAAAPPSASYLTSTALTLAAVRSLETAAEVMVDS
jgi:polar amino acid transport system substrate-binding protein